MVGTLNDRETPPPASKSGTAPSIPVIAGVCVLLAIVAASATNSLAGNPVTSDPSAAATPADSLSSLKTEIERLSARLKKLQERMVTTSKSSPTAELDALRTKIDAFAKATEALAPLLKQVEALDGRVTAIDKQVTTVREQVKALKTAHSVQPTAADEIAPGIEAFKASKFKEANDLFRRLTVSRPEDARVWYYAALSHGLATNDWKDETIRLFKQAVEREKAGTPDKAKIDASLATVTEPSVKKWVDYFRSAAQR